MCFVATKIILVATPANDTVWFSCPAVEAESKIMFEYVGKGFACRSIPASNSLWFGALTVVVWGYT